MTDNVDFDYPRRSRYLRRIARMRDHLGGICQHCGIDNNEALATQSKRLQFDHIDPKTKDFEISPHWAYSWDRIIGELDKCQLLCYECHVDKTQADKARMRPPTVADIEAKAASDPPSSLEEILEEIHSLVELAREVYDHEV